MWQPRGWAQPRPDWLRIFKTASFLTCSGLPLRWLEQLGAGWTSLSLSPLSLFMWPQRSQTSYMAASYSQSTHSISSRSWKVFLGPSFTSYTASLLPHSSGYTGPALIPPGQHLHKGECRSSLLGPSWRLVTATAVSFVWCSIEKSYGFWIGDLSSRSYVSYYHPQSPHLFTYKVEIINLGCGWEKIPWHMDSSHHGTWHTRVHPLRAGETLTIHALGLPSWGATPRQGCCHPLFLSSEYVPGSLVQLVTCQVYCWHWINNV